MSHHRSSTFFSHSLSSFWWINIQALPCFPEFSFTYGPEATSLVLLLDYTMYKTSMVCVRCTFAQVQYYRGKILDWVYYTVASVMDKQCMRETTVLPSSFPESSQLGTKKSGLVRFTVIVSRLPPLWKCFFDRMKWWNLSHPNFCTIEHWRGHPKMEVLVAMVNWGWK